MSAWAGDTNAPPDLLIWVSMPENNVSKLPIVRNSREEVEREIEYQEAGGASIKYGKIVGYKCYRIEE